MGFTWSRTMLPCVRSVIVVAPLAASLVAAFFNVRGVCGLNRALRDLRKIITTPAARRLSGLCSPLWTTHRERSTPRKSRYFAGETGVSGVTTRRLSRFWGDQLVGQGATGSCGHSGSVTPCLPLGPTPRARLPSQSHLSPLSPLETGWAKRISNLLIGEGFSTDPSELWGRAAARTPWSPSPNSTAASS